MADAILLGSGAIFIFVLLVILALTLYRAWGSRPFKMELVPVNDSEPASSVDVASYVEGVCGQFPKTMDIESNG